MSSIALTILSLLVGYLLGRYHIITSITKFAHFPGGFACRMRGELFWILSEYQYLRMSEAVRLYHSGFEEQHANSRQADRGGSE
jgi:hypothetical protein